jgi:hypothetical protein
MQLTPPDSLITNYSMLSNMLTRPEERNVFEATTEWLHSHPDNRFHVVIDELHQHSSHSLTQRLAPESRWRPLDPGLVDLQLPAGLPALGILARDPELLEFARVRTDQRSSVAGDDRDQAALRRGRH